MLGFLHNEILHRRVRCLGARVLLNTLTEGTDNGKQNAMNKRKTEAPGTQRRKEALSHGPLALSAKKQSAFSRKEAVRTQQSAVSQSEKPAVEHEKPKRRRQGKFTLKDLNYPDQRVVRFPMAVGKKTDGVELLTSANLHCLTVEFADRTSLSFMIEPAFTFTAAYEYLEKGKPRAKLWPEIKSRS